MNYFDFEGENYKTIFLMSSLKSFESLKVVFEHLASQRTVWNYLQIPVVFWHNPSTQSAHFFVHDIFILVTLVIVGPLLCVLWRILLSPQGSSYDSPVQSALNVQNPDPISQEDVVDALHLHVFWQLSPCVLLIQVSKQLL